MSSSSTAPARGRGRWSPSGSAASSRDGSGCRCPTWSACELDPALGDAEPHEEIQDLVRASGGLNLGLDFLPGALMFNPAAATSLAAMDPDVRRGIVWLDGLITNPDRTAQNPNLLVWHGRTWLIDHGAALYIHHTWRDPDGPRAARRSNGSPTTSCCRSLAPSWTTDARLAGMLDAEAHRGARRATSRTTWLPDDPVAGDAEAQRRPTSVSRRGGSRRRDRSSRRPSVPAPPRDVFQYAVVRVVPRVERGEQLNAGVILLCRSRRVPRRADRARRGAARGARPGPGPGDGAAAPRGDRADRRGRRSAGPIARLEPAERFHWLVSPASTIIQPSEVHTGCATTRPRSSTTSSRRWSADEAAPSGGLVGDRDLDHRRVGGHRLDVLAASRRWRRSTPRARRRSASVRDDAGRRRQVGLHGALQVDRQVRVGRRGSGARPAAGPTARAAADVEPAVDVVEDDLDAARQARRGDRSS